MAENNAPLTETLATQSDREAESAAAEEEQRLSEEGKIPAILAYVPLLCFYALMLKKDNPYAYHHGKQGLALTIIEIIAVALRWDFIWNLLLIGCAAVAVWGMIKALSGERFRLPLISNILDQFQ